jgi:hypothetical protein
MKSFDMAASNSELPSIAAEQRRSVKRARAGCVVVCYIRCRGGLRLYPHNALSNEAHL